MIIVGIDPSLTSTGICTMSEDGTVLESLAIKPVEKGTERLALFRHDFRLITGKCQKEETYAFVEGYAFGAMNKREALGELGGVLRLSLYDDGIRVVVVPPTSLKKFATGKGNADKIAMAVALQKQYGLEYPTSDQTDAYFLAELGRAYFRLIPEISVTKQEIIEAIKNPKVKKRAKK